MSTFLICLVQVTIALSRMWILSWSFMPCSGCTLGMVD